MKGCRQIESLFCRNVLTNQKYACMMARDAVKLKKNLVCIEEKAKKEFRNFAHGSASSVNMLVHTLLVQFTFIWCK